MSKFPSTMQAVTITGTADNFDFMKKQEMPFPAQLPGHVIIKVQYAGVNFLDNYFRTGLYKAPSFPYILGHEAAGRVVSTPTDPATLNDAEYKKKNFKAGHMAVGYFNGAFAEYISVPWHRTYPLPDSVPVSVGAASFLQGATALTFITEAYNVKSGDKILIHAVAGGVGLIVAQLCKMRGATVIGTTSTEEKAKLAKAHGVDHIILYRNEDTVKRVLELTNGEGVEAAYDGVGKDTFDSNFKMLKRKGTLISLGNASGPVEPLSPLRLVEKNLKLLRPTLINYIYTGEEGRKYSEELFDYVGKGSLKINIYKEYPFTEEGVKSAYRDLSSGKTTGKLLIKVSDD